MPIDDCLDLHAFRPAEVKSLIPEYLAECRSLNISQVRIIHGKGSGTLRALVHKILDRLPWVEGYRFAPDGNWGVTVVELLPLGDSRETIQEIDG
ncbi:Smr/MutS family protein [candidate division KSB1 bacterium]|nr:Smr/MutS family protein [candidate division KSB1 bacterium]